MIRPTPTTTSEDKSLAQQKADFTSEGSPPPGKVDTSTPVTADKTTKARPPAPASVRSVHRGPRFGGNR